ncbi:MAG: hypothetical protein AB8G99_10805 [Planctomycetaceae bacterium]
MSGSSNACQTVGRAGVGESGASSLLHHQVTGEVEINVVLRVIDTSLCPNTGVVGVLTVNGIPMAVGDLTKPGATVSTTATPSDRVVAIMHTVPLFNDTVCIRLGELTAELQQCDLV